MQIESISIEGVNISVPSDKSDKGQKEDKIISSNIHLANFSLGNSSCSLWINPEGKYIIQQNANIPDSSDKFKITAINNFDLSGLVINTIDSAFPLLSGGYNTIRNNRGVHLVATGHDKEIQGIVDREKFLMAIHKGLYFEIPYQAVDKDSLMAVLVENGENSYKLVIIEPEFSMDKDQAKLGLYGRMTSGSIIPLEIDSKSTFTSIVRKELREVGAQLNDSVYKDNFRSLLIELVLFFDKDKIKLGLKDTFLSATAKSLKIRELAVKMIKPPRIFSTESKFGAEMSPKKDKKTNKVKIVPSFAFSFLAENSKNILGKILRSSIGDMIFSISGVILRYVSKERRVEKINSQSEVYDISPDGKFYAYVSIVSGNESVNIREFGINGGYRETYIDPDDVENSEKIKKIKFVTNREIVILTDSKMYFFTFDGSEWKSKLNISSLEEGLINIDDFVYFPFQTQMPYLKWRTGVWGRDGHYIGSLMLGSSDSTQTRYSIILYSNKEKKFMRIPESSYYDLDGKPFLVTSDESLQNNHNETTFFFSMFFLSSRGSIYQRRVRIYSYAYDSSDNFYKSETNFETKVREKFIDLKPEELIRNISFSSIRKEIAIVTSSGRLMFYSFNLDSSKIKKTGKMALNDVKVIDVRYVNEHSIALFTEDKMIVCDFVHANEDE